MGELKCKRLFYFTLSHTLVKIFPKPSMLKQVRQPYNRQIIIIGISCKRFSFYNNGAS